jgi:hypothetical protein
MLNKKFKILINDFDFRKLLLQKKSKIVNQKSEIIFTNEILQFKP